MSDSTRDNNNLQLRENKRGRCLVKNNFIVILKSHYNWNWMCSFGVLCLSQPYDFSAYANTFLSPCQCKFSSWKAYQSGENVPKQLLISNVLWGGNMISCKETGMPSGQAWAGTLQNTALCKKKNHNHNMVKLLVLPLPLFINIALALPVYIRAAQIGIKPPAIITTWPSDNFM